MRRLPWAVLLLFLACTGDLEKKVEKLEGQVKDLETERDKLAKRITDLDKKLVESRDLDRKVDDLLRQQQRTMDDVSRAALAAQRARAEPDKTKVYAVPVGDAPTDGPPDAKVTLIEAYEYACPFCERARTTLADLRRKYGSDLRIVYQSFVVHPTMATAPAYAACAANKQRRFLQMHELLWEKGFKDRKFDTSGCWTASDGCPVVVDFARKAGLETRRFRDDMRRCEVEVQETQRTLQQFGVGATPSFFINGRYMSGAMPIDTFSALIDEELTKANDRIAGGTPKSQYYQKWVMETGLTKL
jgi:protein-disulfide isomerase